MKNTKRNRRTIKLNQKIMFLERSKTASWNVSLRTKFYRGSYTTYHLHRDAIARLKINKKECIFVIFVKDA